MLVIKVSCQKSNQVKLKGLEKSIFPLALYDYCIEGNTCINNLTANTMFNVHDSNAHTFFICE